MKSYADLEQSKRLAEIFPELKEREDERIRREIIDFLRLPHHQFAGKRDHEKWIAWLEKQNKLDNNDTNILNRFSFYSYKDEPNILYLSELYVNKEQRNRGIGTKILKIADKVAVEMKYNLIRLKTEIGSNAERLYRKNGYNFLKMEGNQVWLEKQCDPADKIKPKFHEDDWITNGDYTLKIVGIKPLVYIIQSQDGNIVDGTISYVDEHFHRWTIADAKDGDVLYLQHEGVEHVIIYKRLVKKNFHTILSVHCAYDGSTNDFFDDVDSYHCITSERDEKEIHPATKEQRDLLFAKMKEAGYEWDSEKKELKKIEPKKLDADKVIAWLVANICDFEYYVNSFKKDFGL